MDKKTLGTHAVRIAAAGLGSAVLGPVGHLLGLQVGGLFSAVVPVATESIISRCSAQFGQKAAEKLAEDAGNAVADKFPDNAADLSRLLLEALRLSLKKTKPSWPQYADWFVNWDAALSASELPALYRQRLGSPQMSDDTPSFWEELDALGNNSRRNVQSVIFHCRVLPEDIKKELTNRLRLVIEEEYEHLLVQKGHEKEWKRAQLQFRRETSRQIEELAKKFSSLHATLSNVAHLTTTPSKDKETADESRLRAILPRSRAPIGRDEDIRMGVKAWLSSADKLLLICGQPGIGKSTIGQSILRDPTVEAKFETRRYEFHCDDVSSVDELITQMSFEWFGIRPGRDVILARALKLALEQSASAIFIDNLETLAFNRDEQVRSDCGRLLAELFAIKDLYMIVGCQGLRPPAPLPWVRLEPTPLGLKDARMLFLRSAEHIRFATDPLLDSLLAELDGVPHALELVGRVAFGHRHLQPVLALWKARRTALFSEGNRRSLKLKREDNLEISYDLSIKSLTRRERQALRMLAELPSGMRGEDADKLLPNGELSVSPLVTAAVCAWTDDASRIRMLSPFRTYVQRKGTLSKPNRDKLLAAFLGLAKTGSELDGSHSLQLVSRLQTEEANIAWALETVDTKENRKDFIEAALGFGTYAEHRSVDASIHLRRAVSLCEEVGDSGLKAEALRRLANLERVLHRHRDAYGHYRLARDLFYDAGLKSAQAWCCWGMGDTHVRLDEYNEAQPYFRTALEIFADLNDKRGIGWAYQGLGDCDFMTGLLAAARISYETAQPLLHVARDRKAEAWCFRNLGQIARHDKSFEKSAFHIERAINLFQAVADHGGVGGCLWDLGMSALDQGMLDQATNLFLNGKTEFRKANDLGEAWCVRGLAEVAFRQEDLRAAQTLFRQARVIFHRLSNRRAEAGCLMSLGQLKRKQKRLRCSRFLYGRAREMSAAVQHQVAVDKCDEALARLEQEMCGL